MGVSEEKRQKRRQFSLGFRDGPQMGAGSTLLEVICPLQRPPRKPL